MTTDAKRTNEPPRVPRDIKKALERADVYQRLDIVSATVHMASLNQDEPLTDTEKQRILYYLTLCMFPYKVVFDN